MSTFIACVHCSHQIHESAPACPKCGTPSTTSPSIHASRISNKVVWILAFAPLLGLILEGLVAGALSPNEYYAEQAMASSKYWYISLILNIGLCLLEESRLKKAGVDTSSFGKLVFIVPVYLWNRSKALNQSPAYFWTWIALFVFAMLSTAVIGE